MSGRDQAKFGVRLIDQVSGPARKATRALDRLNAAGKKLQKTERAGDKLTAKRKRAQRAGGGGRGGGMLDIVGGNLLTGAVTKVASLAVEIGKAGAAMVTFGQNSKLAFSNLTKHGVDPGKLFEHATALAVRFGLDLEDTTHQYQKFLALQFTPRGADKLIRMGADLRALGTDAEGVQGVFTALGQIKGKGKLQGDEMLQLAERGISTKLVTEEIGKLLGGKSDDEVQKLQGKGKITADIALEAIERAINRKLQQSELGESGAKFADQTIDGMIGRFKALGQKAALGMFDKVAAPLTKLMSKGLVAFEGFLTSPAGAKMIERIATGLERAAVWAGDFAVSFGKTFSDQFTTRVVPLIDSLTGIDSGNAEQLGAKFAEMAVNLAKVVALAIKLGDKLIGLANGPVGKLVSATMGGSTNGIDAIGNGVLEAGKVLDDNKKGIAEKAWGVGTAIAAGLGKGIWEGAKNGPIGIATQMAGATIDKVKDVFGIHSPSRVMMGIGANVSAGLAIGAERQRPLLLSSGDSIASAQIDGVQSRFAQPQSFAAQEERFYGPEVRSMRAPVAEGDMGARGGVGDVRMPITINVHGTSNSEETARMVGSAVRRELEAVWRQMEMELG